VIEEAIEERASAYQRIGVTPLPTPDDPALSPDAVNRWHLEHIPPEAPTSFYRQEMTITPAGTRVARWILDTAQL
jgi:hypothetical protein